MPKYAYASLGIPSSFTHEFLVLCSQCWWYFMEAQEWKKQSYVGGNTLWYINENSV